MASRKENLKSLFTNTRSRVIIIFTVLLVVIAIIVGYLKFFSALNPELASARLQAVPGIESTPGALNPTPEYAKLQMKQNIEQAQKAAESGGSAIPTIIRTHAIDERTKSISKAGEGGAGFTALAQTDEAGVQKGLWLQNLKDSNCSQATLQKVISQGAQLPEIRSACSCAQLKAGGYSLGELKDTCPCTELKKAGVTAAQLREIGYTAGALRDCGFSACEVKAAGFSALEMKEGGFTDGELKGAGFSDEDIAKASGIPDNMTASDIQKKGCGVAALRELRAQGVSAAAIRRINGCTARQMKDAGFSAKELMNAGFSAAELKKAGFDAAALKGLAKEGGVIDKNLPKDCSVAELTKARLNGVSARAIKENVGCDAEAMKAAGYTASALKDAGFTAAELKRAGFSPKELKDAGFSAKELKDAGFSAEELKDAGFNAKQLKDAGFSPEELRKAGFSAAELKEAGFSAEALRKAGFSARDLKRAGFTNAEVKDAGYSAAELKAAGISGIQGLADEDTISVSSELAAMASENAPNSIQAQEAANARQLQAALDAQNKRMANQQFQQQIQQRTSDMSNEANSSIQAWSRVSTQVYTATTEVETKGVTKKGIFVERNGKKVFVSSEEGMAVKRKALILTGDILFAVIDTAIDSDEPGPILATIVSGRLKGGKLIGSFVLPNDAGKMVITFNTLSMPGTDHSTSISAYAIDENTGRTALSSSTNRHYFAKYGALFASSFLEGFGNAFQSANTTVTVGGTGGGGNVTVQNGIGRSALENAVIGLATVGKSWGQFAQQQMNKPATVRVYAGTAIGVLFTQDLITL